MLTQTIDCQSLWQEVPAQMARGHKQPARVVLYELRPEKGGTGCHCWRCGGVVALADRPVLDRLLARHLLRQPEAVREEFLFNWNTQPGHHGRAQEQLEAWLRIEARRKDGKPAGEPEPSYPIYSLPGAA
ncbi:hypothetical protein KYT87_21345 [Achromobacter sp. ES-001]|uniref:hypothetical protein n=1 Tax=Achromobacter sp. ES-001 TaxID=2860286 RepID=UPI001C6426C0|nr:hypothetical protein [Achromobacter sp. ES-001]QYJ20200.1 hypothetical protein KYT87_21345 [Achromobacter sp. ES-001]